MSSVISLEVPGFVVRLVPAHWFPGDAASITGLLILCSSVFILWLLVEFPLGLLYMFSVFLDLNGIFNKTHKSP